MRLLTAVFALLLFTTAGSADSIWFDAAITDLVAKYPKLVGKGPLLIEIDPQSVQPVGWGFVSVTNNETQHVTVVSPQ